MGVGLQIAVGSGLLMVNISLAAIAAVFLEQLFNRCHGWLMREPHYPKLALLLAGVSLVILGVVTTGVWVWAGAYMHLGVFATLEESVYSSLVSFTSLGLGDVLLHTDWRSLAGLEAAYRFLQFGLLTALSVETLQRVTLLQA